MFFTLLSMPFLNQKKLPSTGVFQMCLAPGATCSAQRGNHPAPWRGTIAPRPGKLLALLTFSAE